VETYPVPTSALREAVINAILHRDYGTTMHTQIRIYDDKIVIKNSGTLPDNRTFDDFLKKRDSVPHNPAIAETFYFARIAEK
jgi:ATP-dependent DNA helicase RecG